MSLHPSLKIDAAGATQRSVLSRIERIKDLMKKGLWTQDQAVTGLPKSKIVRIKAKKAVKAKAEEGAVAGAAGASEAGAKKPDAAKKPESGAAKKPDAASKDKK